MWHVSFEDEVYSIVGPFTENFKEFRCIIVYREKSATMYFNDILSILNSICVTEVYYKVFTTKYDVHRAYRSFTGTHKIIEL